MAGSIYALHTSAYGANGTEGYMFDKPSLPMGYEDIKLNSINGQIKALEDRENAFCSKFGYRTPDELIGAIRNILKSSSKDMIALQRFSSTNLRRYFEQFKTTNNSQLEGQTVHITFSTDKKDKQIMDLFNDSGGSENIRWSMNTSGEHDFALEWNYGRVKNIVNKVASKHFVTTSKNIDLLIKYILGDANNLINITVGQNNQPLQDFLLKNRASMFQYSQEEIRQLMKTDPAFYNEISKRIHNFIYGTLCQGASEDFMRAVNTVMGQQLTSPAGIGFFVGGADKWITNTVGNLGELQGAILFQYFANKTNNAKASQEISRIIGNVTNNGQKLPSDLELFEAFGIQVKNYSDSITKEGEQRTIKINLHPSQLQSIGPSTLAGYMANSYFNKDVEQFSEGEINDFIKSHTTELLNLDLNLNNWIDHNTVTFYLVGGHLMPGSALISAALINQSIEVNTTFSHPEPIDDDAGFNTGTKTVNDKTVDWDRPFHKYWKSNKLPPSTGDFSTIGDNGLMASIDGRISFHTTFTYSALFTAKYKLF